MEVYEGAPNTYINPFAEFIVAGLVHSWCKDNPLPDKLEEDNAWHWNLAAMDQLHKTLCANDPNCKVYGKAK